MEEHFINRRSLILHHPLFRRHYKKILHCEKNRIFCRHDMAHFLDVARIAMIINLREDYGIDEELIYAAALLHDIGRHRQYKSGIDHAAASVPIAEAILADCRFTGAETACITAAITNHRNEKIKEARNLCGLIYRADKMSRNCFCCRAADSCNWPEEKKRRNLIY